MILDDPAVADSVYRIPRDLEVTALPLRRVLLVGKCLINIGWNLRSIYPCDFVTVNQAQLPASPPQPIEAYDFQVVQLPLRAVLNERSYMRLDYEDVRAHEQLFESARQRLREVLDFAMPWNVQHGLLTFVLNFLPPQQNPLGRFLPRYDQRNLVNIVERLNEALAEMVAGFQNAYLFDFDSLVTTFGRRHFQGDSVWATGGQLHDGELQHDLERLDGPRCATDLYPSKRDEIMDAAWAELVAMYRTVRQTDRVKLVIFGLDDTLWRGVPGDCKTPPDEVVIPQYATEGWPLGFTETLMNLKRRGLRLAVVSKNYEQRIDALWDRILRGNLTREDLAASKINWRPKAENIDEILRELDVRPRETVFIDDDPVERATVATAFPEIRTFGSNPYLWRRILLWASETQVASIGSRKNAPALIENATQRANTLADSVVPDNVYRAPRDLETTDLPLHRILLIGSGTIDIGWLLRSICPSDFLSLHDIERRAVPPNRIEEYDFQVVQIPLRAVLNERAYIRLTYGDIEGHQKLFESALEKLRKMLELTMRWNVEDGLPTFVLNFLVPQQNPLGRLLLRYDPRNIVDIIERLNQSLAGMVAEFRAAYVLDFDSVVSTFGRRYFHEDAVWVPGQNDQLHDGENVHDLARLDGAPRKATELYPSKRSVIMEAAFTEMIAMYRTLRQIDRIKLVIFGLDDTLWRGISPEQSPDEIVVPQYATEGWPLGFTEALINLKRRGLLLAAVSKNDEARIGALWDRILNGNVTRDDLAACKINWHPKAENVGDVLRELGVLPRETIFIDDNPVERAAVGLAFPEIRTFGPNPYLWRRVLLWSPEAQVARIGSRERAATDVGTTAQLEPAMNPAR